MGSIPAVVLGIVASLVSLASGAVATWQFLRRRPYALVRVIRRDRALFVNDMEVLLALPEMNREFRRFDLKDVETRSRLLTAYLDQTWTPLDKREDICIFPVRRFGRAVLMVRFRGSSTAKMEEFDVVRGHEYQFEVSETGRSFLLHPIGVFPI